MTHVPTEPGWYWWKCRIIGVRSWQPVEVTRDLNMIPFWQNNAVTLHHAKEIGIFGPRIPEPEGEQK